MHTLEQKRQLIIAWLQRHGYRNRGGHWEVDVKLEKGTIRSYRVDVGAYTMTQSVLRHTWGGPRGLRIEWVELRDGFIKQVSFTADDKLSGLDKIDGIING